MNKRKNNRAFTLVELVFVLAMLAIILSIGIAAYPKLFRSTNIKADRVSASYIVKALRSWYADGISDIQKNEEFKAFISENLYLKTVKLSELSSRGVDIFLDSNYLPTSLVDELSHPIDNQIFGVGMIGEGEEKKFVITVETEDNRLEGLANDCVADYEGKSIGVICIED